MESEDGTGSRRPLLGDVGVSPHLFHSISAGAVALDEILVLQPLFPLHIEIKQFITRRRFHCILRF